MKSGMWQGITLVNPPKPRPFKAPLTSAPSLWNVLFLSNVCPADAHFCVGQSLFSCSDRSRTFPPSPADTPVCFSADLNPMVSSSVPHGRRVLSMGLPMLCSAAGITRLLQDSKTLTKAKMFPLVKNSLKIKEPNVEGSSRPHVRR